MWFLDFLKFALLFILLLVVISFVGAFGASMCSGADFYVKPDKPQFEVPKLVPLYPSLYEEDRDKGVILVIGFEGCGHCKTLIDSIPKRTDGKPMFRHYYVDFKETDPLNKSDDAPTWDEWREKGGLKPMYPAVLILKADPEGEMEIKKAFTGALAWSTFLKAAEFARIEYDDNSRVDEIRNRWLDFIIRERSKW